MESTNEDAGSRIASRKTSRRLDWIELSRQKGKIARGLAHPRVVDALIAKSAFVKLGIGLVPDRVYDQPRLPIGKAKDLPWNKGAGFLLPHGFERRICHGNSLKRLRIIEKLQLSLSITNIDG